MSNEKFEPVAYGMWDTQLGRNARLMMVRLDKGQDGCTVPLFTHPPDDTALHRQALTALENSAVKHPDQIDGRSAAIAGGSRGFSRTMENKVAA